MASTDRSNRKRTLAQPSQIRWATDTELVGIVLELQPDRDCTLYPQYAIALHAWFLDQVRQSDPELSAYLHDGESEKAFTISRLEGLEFGQSYSPRLKADATYRWVITALSKEVVQWMAKWLKSRPSVVEIRDAPLTIVNWSIAHSPTTYEKLWEASETVTPPVTLSFVSPTSFRRKGYHYPLPVPTNVFHSYLRRWNDFAPIIYDPDEFLDWIDESVVISRVSLQSTKTVAGKKGSVTGFTGAIEFGLTKAAYDEPEYVQLWLTLGQLAPYCGTGHKTTFGLGQTRIGWLDVPTPAVPTVHDLLAQRIAELTDLFVAQRKRTGGDRATNISETWATILARRELGESLQTIASDLELSYETAKKYSKLARKAMREMPAE